jgi:hypothetical protein
MPVEYKGFEIHPDPHTPFTEITGHGYRWEINGGVLSAIATIERMIRLGMI